MTGLARSSPTGAFARAFDSRAFDLCAALSVSGFVDRLFDRLFDCLARAMVSHVVSTHTMSDGRGLVFKNKNLKILRNVKQRVKSDEILNSHQIRSNLNSYTE